MSRFTPATIARQAAARRETARKRYEDGRRADARAHGYRGPLTREEASAMVLAELAALAGEQ